MINYERLLDNATIAYNNSHCQWGREYWLEVIEKLLQNMEKKDLH